MKRDWDYIIIGSGFGGSVSALRLVEKGYKVLVLEKGKRFEQADFPKTNWDLKHWLWRPELGWRGLFAMTFLRHVTILSGVGVGGGSLVYANTLPKPTDDFFESPSWSHLAEWKRELEPHYETAWRMLGATPNPYRTYADEVIREIGREIGREEHFHPTTVGVYFGKPGVEESDPYFGGEGPTRTGCVQCGGCMLGCRYNAKNTLDKNYLYLAENRGLVIEPDTEVTGLRPLEGGGYEVEARQGARQLGRKRRTFTTRGVILAGGVMGSVELLLRLKQRADGLPRLSDRVGDFIRTNSEVLMGAVTRQKDRDFSKGIAIGSILHTDERSHLEPVRYPEGAGFFRLMATPHTTGERLPQRLFRAARKVLSDPIGTVRTHLVSDWAKSSIILLYMRAAEGHLRMRLGRLTGRLTTDLSSGEPPKAFIPEASELGERVAQKVDGQAKSLITELLQGIPTTAHILGGACMGATAEEGVIDHRHRVFGYDDLYVIDGSAVSANPGVNPSLTICALAERAMSFIPARSARAEPSAHREESGAV